MSEIGLMTPEQFDQILADLRSGVPLDQAARRAHVGMELLQNELDASENLSEIVDDCIAQGRASQRTARSYTDDPRPNENKPPAVALPRPSKKRAATDGEGEKAGPVWERIETEAQSLAPGQYGYFLWLNAKCAALGMHKISPWWLASTGAFYESGKRWMIVRCGRGGGKSTSLIRLAVSEAIFGNRIVPPGQNWIWPFISINATDAGRRIPEAVAILDCLGIEYKLHRAVGKQSIDMLDRNGQQVSFLSLACNISALSGPTAIGGTVDEEAKLFDKATNANPASEVIASLLQTFRGHEDVRAVRCSSAWDNKGSHADAIAEGDTSQNFIARISDDFVKPTVDGLQEVAAYVEKSDKAGAQKIRAYAATVTADSPNICTWIANPSRTALGCYRDNEALPKQVDIFLRENASVPLVGGGVDAGDSAKGFAEFNRKLIARSKVQDGIHRFANLPSYDPRSTRYRPPGSGGGGGCVM